jgi:hypothetical protein
MYGFYWHIFFMYKSINQKLKIMAEKEKITNPSMGSNKLGEETEEIESAGVSAGTDTQLKLTALGGKKHSEKQKTNDDIQKEKNKAEFLAKNKVD